MNQKLLLILTRSDFDRPIMMHDKLDYIWDKGEGSEFNNVDQQKVKQQLKNRKYERVMQNIKQAKAYQNLLNGLSLRKINLTNDLESIQKVHEVEREFLDAFRTMIESGYALTEADFFELLEVLKVQSCIRTIHQLEKTTAFFIQVAKQLNFSVDAVISKLTSDWIVEPS